MSDATAGEGGLGTAKGGDPACWLVLGLGNPGPEYEGTYHNVGFRVVDVLARRRNATLSVRMGAARIARLRASLFGGETVLVKPWTYMNRTGAVLPVLFERFGAGSRLLVVSDDLALPVGKIRIRERGSPGGHNGLKSISSAYGSDEYVRVRVGIGLDENDRGESRRERDTRDYVLSRVSKAHRQILAEAENLAADAVEDVIAAGAGWAMSRYNGVDLRRAD